MRRPLLMAAALGVAAIPIALFTWSERPRPAETVHENLSTFDVEESAAPPNAEAPQMAALPTPPAPARAALREVAEGEPPASSPGTGPVIPQTAPRVAYSYGYRFRVPGDALAAVQERHLQLCLSMGAASCRVVSMQRSETRAQAPARDHGYGGGQPAAQAPAASLEVQVAARLADGFGRRLAASTDSAGGEIVSRQIGAEDVSREMVDSEARIRTRETLIRRLSALLETRSGNIEQAVQAERAINQAQEELEAARAWLAETRGRVAMSRIAIAYEAAGAPSAPARSNPIATALDRVGSLTAHSLAALLLIAGLAIPWGLAGALIWYLARWHRRRTVTPEPVTGT
jgi:hypothetical protein